VTTFVCEKIGPDVRAKRPNNSTSQWVCQVGNAGYHFLVPTLLAIIPHPDDESYSFGGTIALAAKAGWRCVVHCASAGEKGKRQDGGATGRDAVGRARKRELEASCRVLGAEPPIVWGLPDGGLSFCPSQATRVRELVSEFQPHLVLALGSDGAYGHPDHIAVYRWVLEAWRGSSAPPLLFAAFESGLFLPQYEKCIGMMGDPPEPAPEAIGATGWHYTVDVSRVQETKLAAIGAHRSQLPEGDPHAIFPSEIVGRLLTVERFTDATGGQQPAVQALLDAFS